jgi:hypothetical protein
LIEILIICAITAFFSFVVTSQALTIRKLRRQPTLDRNEVLSILQAAQELPENLDPLVDKILEMRPVQEPEKPALIATARAYGASAMGTSPKFCNFSDYYSTEQCRDRALYRVMVGMKNTKTGESYDRSFYVCKFHRNYMKTKNAIKQEQPL